MTAHRGMKKMEKTMKSTGRKTMKRAVRSILLAAAAGMVLSAAPAGAAVVLTDTLAAENAERDVRGGVMVDTEHGMGWRSSRPYKPRPGAEGFTGSDLVTYHVGRGILPSDRGMVEILMVNSHRGATHDDGKEGPDTVFEFFSMREKKTTMAVRVDWVESWITFGGEDYSHDMFAYKVPIPRIGVGESAHLIMRWDDSGYLREVTVNGRTIPVVTPIVPTSRTKDLKPKGLRRMPSAPLGDLLERADAVRLGAMGHDEEYWPDGEQPANDTAIIAFAVHDDPSGPSVLGGEAAAPAAIASVEHNANSAAGFSGSLVPGDTISVSVTGTPGAAAVFDVVRQSTVLGEIAVDWKGFGVYLEEKTFFDEGEIDLRDVKEYRVYAATEPLTGIDSDTQALETLEVEEQSYVIDGLESETPYYVYVMALMDDGTMVPVVAPPSGISMAEGEPGTYEGALTVPYGEVSAEAVVVGRVISGGSSMALAGEETFEIDGSLKLSVAASPAELKADEKSTSDITVVVTDANGEPVSGHEIRFVLATTSQYTGVVGGGQFAEEVGGSLGREFTAITDLFGQVEVTYTAGFAAKTAIIVARDMVSNDTGAASVKTYITATAELELEAVQEVAGKALGYSIAVTSSDEWLTADGESEARITALVTKDGIPVEGHRIGFSVSGGSGRIRTVQGVTDEDGKARAVYTAGTKIGMVLIRAIDHTVGISGAVQIELRSDAPAKIGVVVTPDVLPADGRSTADVEVVVTDINDNPNEGVEVEYAVAIGSGRLRSIDEVTDSRGESTAEYVAGRIPGKVAIEVTVRSTDPAEEEMSAARDLATAVTDYDFY